MTALSRTGIGRGADVRKWLGMRSRAYFFKAGLLESHVANLPPKGMDMNISSIGPVAAFATVATPTARTDQTQTASPIRASNTVAAPTTASHSANSTANTSTDSAANSAPDSTVASRAAAAGNANGANDNFANNAYDNAVNGGTPPPPVQAATTPGTGQKVDVIA